MLEIRNLKKYFEVNSGTLHAVDDISISIDEGKEFITLSERNVNWLNAKGDQIAWPKYCSDKALPMSELLTPWFTVSQELKDLVKNNFKSEEDIRFEKQQDLTWISIAAATIIGLLGIIL